MKNSSSPSESFRSAEEWLDELESELVSVSPSTSDNIASNLLNIDSENDHKITSRKLRNRMIQLYIAIAGEDLKTKTKKSSFDNQPYYTIVDSNNTNLHNINRGFLKKLDAKEIAQLKTLMLTRELSNKSQFASNIQTEINTNGSNQDQMLVLCSPINSKTNQLIDSLIDQIEKHYVHSSRYDNSLLQSSNSESTSMDTSNASSTATLETFEFEEFHAKTEQLKAKMMNLKRKYELLKQKKSVQQSRKKKLFSAHTVNSTQRKSRKKSKTRQTNTKNNSKADKHGQIVERRSASIHINPKSLQKVSMNKQTKRKIVKTKRTRRRNPAARIPWRG